MTETPVLDRDEAEALLGAVNPRTPTGARNYALLQLMLQTGVRCGEALKVMPGDIRQEDWPSNGGTVRLWVLRLSSRATKGQKARQGLPLSPATRQALDRWQEKRAALGLRSSGPHGGPLFCTISRGKATGLAGEGAELKPGRPLNARYVRNLVARLAEKAGIRRRVHPHMLRHTALTELYDRTGDLRLVQDVAGHASSRMTERYTHVHPIAVARAMGAMEDDGSEGR